MSHIDYITVMKVLSENLSEGNEELTVSKDQSTLNLVPPNLNG